MPYSPDSYVLPPLPFQHAPSLPGTPHSSPISPNFAYSRKPRGSSHSHRRRHEFYYSDSGSDSGSDCDAAGRHASDSDTDTDDTDDDARSILCTTPTLSPRLAGSRADADYVAHKTADLDTAAPRKTSNSSTDSSASTPRKCSTTLTGLPFGAAAGAAAAAAAAMYNPSLASPKQQRAAVPAKISLRMPRYRPARGAPAAPTSPVSPRSHQAAAVSSAARSMAALIHHQQQLVPLPPLPADARGRSTSITVAQIGRAPSRPRHQHTKSSAPAPVSAPRRAPDARPGMPPRQISSSSFSSLSSTFSVDTHHSASSASSCTSLAGAVAFSNPFGDAQSSRVAASPATDASRAPTFQDVTSAPASVHGAAHRISKPSAHTKSASASAILSRPLPPTPSPSPEPFSAARHNSTTSTGTTVASPVSPCSSSTRLPVTSVAFATSATLAFSSAASALAVRGRAHSVFAPRPAPAAPVAAPPVHKTARAGSEPSDTTTAAPARVASGLTGIRGISSSIVRKDSAAVVGFKYNYSAPAPTAPTVAPAVPAAAPAPKTVQPPLAGPHVSMARRASSALTALSRSKFGNNATPTPISAPTGLMLTSVTSLDSLAPAPAAVCVEEDAPLAPTLTSCAPVSSSPCAPITPHSTLDEGLLAQLSMANASFAHIPQDQQRLLFGLCLQGLYGDFAGWRAIPVLHWKTHFVRGGTEGLALNAETAWRQNRGMPPAVALARFRALVASYL